VGRVGLVVLGRETLRLPVLPEDRPPPARAQASSLKVRLKRQNMPRMARKVFSREELVMFDSP
jgi:hypothetical protein